MEAEYIQSITTISNTVWIKHFVESLNLGLNSKPVNMFCDNKFAISLIKKWSTKLQRQTYWCKLSLYSTYSGEGEIKVEFITSFEMVADHMTK
jgi:hypothetical protein